MISNSNTTNQTTSKRLPSPAMIVSLLALFVALSGTAFAIEANSIASKHVRDDSLKSEDLKDGAGVTGDDIQAESIGDGPLGLDSVGPGDLQEDAVRTYNISDGHVTVSDIGIRRGRRARAADGPPAPRGHRHHQPRRLTKR